MALQRIQSSTGANSGFLSTVSSSAFASALTNPSLIIVSFTCDLATTSANQPTDTAGNTYVRAVRFASGGTNTEVWYALNTKTTASNVVTVTDNGAGVNSAVVVEEWTGHNILNPFDKSANATSTGTAIDTGATATLSQPNEAVIVTAVAAVTGNQLSLGSGFSNLAQTFNGTPVNLGTASKVVSSTTGVNGLMTTGSATWFAIVTTWKEAITPSIGWTTA